MSTFQVLPFTHDEFIRSLSNRLIASADVAAHRRADYLRRYLEYLGAKTLVVEEQYTDGDYLDDFASYYVKCFRDYDRRCKRLHFFSQGFDEAAFKAQILGGPASPTLATFAESYLGFIVARPLPQAIIGRTVLATYPSDGGRRNYPCTRDYKPNLFGIELKVRSLPFQEQDSVLAACATVALWSAFHKAAELFGTGTPTPVEITREANRVVHPGRALPSAGLRVEQICNSIRHVGLEPEVVRMSADLPLVSLIYAHLRLGLPILLIIDVPSRGLHAVTLNGFSLRPQGVRASEVAPGLDGLPFTGLRIDEFYGHDDQSGPFTRLLIRHPPQPNPANGRDDFPVYFEEETLDPATGQAATFAMYPVCLVVPVYHKIRVTFLDVLGWLTRFHRAIVDVLNVPGPEWDPHLITSNDYKRQANGSGLTPRQQEEILFLPHPRFVWRALLCFGGTPALELLFDATDMARSFPLYRVLWRDVGFRQGALMLLAAPQIQAALRGILTPQFADMLQAAQAP